MFIEISSSQTAEIQKRISPTFPANLLEIYWISIVLKATKTPDHHTETGIISV